ncbi:thioredoxin|uniref:Thioredoxin n=1 Tax=Dendrosporobacter quercicolus TaxID=146817 RepID=A0A1G9MEX3_9FIRM|nr:thioredoxin [Dendrosporobacter quercicolus]NSL47018.1 thioredoxin [Dendrosporobacter quercicolus DSM 1736]SDL72818.1 thioredoxin [Dendrosporobacter quercicolus]
MASVLNITEDTFKEEVVDIKTPVLVDFWAPWCGYCTKLSPVFDELATELADKVKLVKVNVDENRKLTEQQGVMSLPTVILYIDGEPAEKVVGFLPKAALLAKITPHL